MGSSTRESLAAITRRFSSSTNELPGNDIPDISIQEMDDTSTAPVELQAYFSVLEMEADVHNGEPYDILAEYMRPRHGWHEFS